MKQIAFFNNKGGVGKSTATINVAHAMARLGKRVEVVDCDSQENTFKFFADPENPKSHDTRYENIIISRHDDYVFANDFNYIIYDLPAELNDWTAKIISTCDYIFIPIELGMFSFQGIAQVTETVAATGVKWFAFVNKFERENPADYKLDEMLRANLSDKVLAARLPYSRVIKNSISYNKTAFEYMEWTTPAEMFTAFTREIVAICEGVTAHG
jgi:cellulose biosynthesis protein BcsQ